MSMIDPHSQARMENQNFLKKIVEILIFPYDGYDICLKKKDIIFIIFVKIFDIFLIFPSKFLYKFLQI